MPRKYKRKAGVQARVVSWTADKLQPAFNEMDKGIMGINEISRLFGIPSRTLRRRYAAQNKTQLTLGKHPVLGFQNEKRLVNHILKLADAGFPPNRQTICMLAYQFAEKLKLKHKFDNEKQSAGNAWFKSFIERNPELSIRQAEGLSVARAKGLSREEVTNFYELLTKVMTDNGLLNKPERIYNMDESGVQLNNKPGKVVAKKGAKVVHSVTSAEKGETMTIVACCNAIGNFLPPVVIIKGVNKKPDFENGLPQGSKVYMNKKSAYINSELFYKWLIEHFVPLKPQGKVLLILDGHASHSSAPDMLQAAIDNDIILLCLPSHTTSALQPLDKSFFGPLKTYFNHETNHFMRTNPNKKISRYNAGTLIRNAWTRAATPSNAIGGFRGSGIYPLNPNALPDTVFIISDIALREAIPREPSESAAFVGPTSTPLPQASSSLDRQPELVDERENTERAPEEVEPRIQTPPSQISSSIVDCRPNLASERINISNIDPNRTPENLIPTPLSRESPSLLIDPDIIEDISIVDIGDDTIAQFLETPSKFLVEASPIPQIPLTMSKRVKQSADILNTEEKIKEKNYIAERKKLQIQTMLDKRNKTKTEKKVKTNKNKTDTKGKGKLKEANKETKDKERVKRVYKRKRRNTYYKDDYSETDFSDDFSEKENYNYVKVSEGRGAQKRQSIYSSSSDGGDYPLINYKTKGKKTKGLPVKKTNKDKQESFEHRNEIKSSRKRHIILSSNSETEDKPGTYSKMIEEKCKDLSVKKNKREKQGSSKHTDENNCIECFDSYENTKSKSDWIQCISCQKWLHETCTLFKNYCSRCGKERL